MRLSTPLLLGVLLISGILTSPLATAAEPVRTKTDNAFQDAVSAVVDEAVKSRRLVGAVVLIAQDGKLVYHHAAGMADRENNTPMQEDAVFQLASMTKPIVTATAFHLIEQGKLNLDDPVTRWLPEFRPKLADGTVPVITVRQLMSHTSGLTYRFMQPSDGSYHQANVSDGLNLPGLSATENLQRLASVPLTYPPGEQWGYSLSIDVLGEVIARAADKPLPRLIHDVVTGPLNMTETAFYPVHPERLVVHYADGKPEPVRIEEGHHVPFGPGDGFRFSPDRWKNKDSFPSGGAGLIGTAEDYMKFLEALRTGSTSVVNAKSAKTMLTNQTGTLAEPSNGPGWGFGFGAAILTDPVAGKTPQSVGTAQWGGAYGHVWWIDPVQKLTVVSLTNTTLEGMSGPYTIELRDAIYSRLPKTP